MNEHYASVYRQDVEQYLLSCLTHVMSSRNYPIFSECTLFVSHWEPYRIRRMLSLLQRRLNINCNLFIFMQ